MTDNVLSFPTKSKVRAAVLRKQITIQNTKYESMTPRAALLMFADVMEQNAGYLAELESYEVEPVAESLLDMVAKIRAWLD
jgi:hypothetical protein